LLIGQAAETDVAQAVTRSTPGTIIVPVGQATEADAAQPVAINPQRRLISAASDIALAQPLTIRKLKTLGIAIDNELAQAMARCNTTAVVQAAEVELAHPSSWNPKRRVIGQAIEVNFAQPIGAIFGALARNLVHVDAQFAVGVARSVEMPVAVQRSVEF